MRVWGYVLILIGLCTGCSGDAGVEKTLNAAADLMEERPDSALFLLEELPAGLIVDRRQSARYALLLTQARHKNYIDEQNDSLIGVAVDYFQRHGGEEEQMKSLFYQGVVRNNVGDYGRAIICAMRAKELAEKLQDEYWAGRSCELMADIYSATYFFNEALESRKQAVRYFEKAKSEVFQKYALLRLATAYLDKQDNAQSCALLDSLVRRVPLSHADSVFTACCQSSLLSALLYSDKYVEAVEVFKCLQQYNRVYDLTVLDYVNAAEVNLEVGDREQARVLLDSAFAMAGSESEKVAANVAQMLYLKQEKDYLNALNVTDSLLRWQDRKILEILNQSVVLVQRDYYQQQSVHAVAQEKQTRFVLELILLIVLLIIILIVAFHKFKIRLKSAEVERKISEIQLLSDMIQQSKIENEHLESRLSEQTENIVALRDRLGVKESESCVLKEWVENLFRDRFATINMLCNEYFEKGDSERMKLMLYKEVEAEIRRFAHPDNLKRIEEMVNGCLEQIIMKLRCQLPGLKEEDVTFLTLLYAGFVPRAVCLFLEIKLKTFYTKRSRLRERILRSDAPDREWFVKKMN